MSSTSSVQKTEEEKTFLESLEEEFKDRYTENDAEFQAVLKAELPHPPIVENWSGFRRDNFRSNRDNCRDDGRFSSYSRRYPFYHRRDGYSHSSKHYHRP